MAENDNPPMLHPRVRYKELAIRDRGYLPHWEKDEATYFITFRLYDSLPQGAQRKSMREEHEELDRNHGSCYLRVPNVAAAIRESILFLNAKRYRLLAWCVMPNHVHLVFRVLSGHELSRIMHSLKSFTANKANKLLRRCGPFWQREYYDHIIRNEDELGRAIRYVLNNPAKANLENWKWVGTGPAG